MAHVDFLFEWMEHSLKYLFLYFADFTNILSFLFPVLFKLQNYYSFNWIVSIFTLTQYTTF